MKKLYLNKNTWRSQKCSAYLTVYLSLVMTLMLSLCLTLIEGTRYNAIQLETECVVDIAQNSILSEYHRELFERYGIFAIDSSYGTDYATRENTERHLSKYIERNFSKKDIFLSGLLYRDFLGIKPAEIEVTGVSLLTDDNGAAFRRQAVEVMKEDLGIGLMEDLMQWMTVIDDNDLLERDIEAEKRMADEEIERILEEEEEKEERAIYEETGVWEDVDISFDNPTRHIELFRTTGLLECVIWDTLCNSDKFVDNKKLLTGRIEDGKVSHGNLPVRKNAWNMEGADKDELLERYFFQEYLLKYMGNYLNEKEEGALKYQIEYLIGGYPSDVENLRDVGIKICLIREVANTVYLYSDQEKCQQADVAAQALAALLTVPEIAPVLKHSILLGWAMAESIHDVGAILRGGKIPLLKTKENWCYDIVRILTPTQIASSGEEEGLAYEDYLRIFMTVTSIEKLTGRAMNLIEADIRQTPGNRYFRMDGCYDSVQVRVKVNSAYGYRYETTCQKGY